MCIRDSNEIELAIADIETFVVKSEQRQDVLSEMTQPTEKPRPKVQQEDNDSQLSLF